MKYRPEIDGLRAIAIVPVVLFHAGLPGFNGGFVGVDIFFVISGYLITSIILSDILLGKFSLFDFYARRSRRIMPALTVLCLAFVPLAFFAMTNSELRLFFQSLVAVSIFSANFFFYLKTDYFAPAAELSPMLHMWSLAVEEQFYLFFPILLVFLKRHFPDRLAETLGALLLLSLIAYLVGDVLRPAATFYMLPTRIWELMAGSLCAFPFLRSKIEKVL